MAGPVLPSPPWSHLLLLCSALLLAAVGPMGLGFQPHSFAHGVTGLIPWVENVQAALAVGSEGKRIQLNWSSSWGPAGHV